MRGMDFDFERWARASGVAFVVVAVAAFIVMGEAPKISDTPEEVISYFSGDSGRVLTVSVLWVIAMGLLGLFVGTLANLLRENGQGWLAGPALILSAAFIGTQVVVTAINGALALNIADSGDASLIHGLYTVSWAGDVMTAIPLAGLLAAVSIGLMRARLIPDWLSLAGLGAAAVALLRGTDWADDGFWSPTGEWSYIAGGVAMLWTLVTSVILVRAAGRAQSTMPTMPPATGSVAA